MAKHRWKSWPSQEIKDIHWCSTTSVYRRWNLVWKIDFTICLQLMCNLCFSKPVHLTKPKMHKLQRVLEVWKLSTPIYQRRWVKVIFNRKNKKGFRLKSSSFWGYSRILFLLQNKFSGHNPPLGQTIWTEGWKGFSL